MKPSELVPEIIDAMDAGIAVEIISDPGRGKSETVANLVNTLSARDGFQWGFTTMFLATYSPADLMGYLMPVQRADGTVASQFSTPAWMITSEGKHINEYRRGIVFMDEYGQGEGDVKRCSAQLLLKKEIGPHRLHDGIAVIAASNKSGGRNGVTKNFDFCINRRMEFYWTDSVDEWEDWAISKDVTPLTRLFVNQHPHIVFSTETPEKQGPMCTPRSIVMNDNFLKVKMARNNGELPMTPAIQEAMSGMIGEGAARQLFVVMRLQQEMPKFEAIVAEPMKAKVPDKPDAQMLVCYNLAHRVCKDTVPQVLKYVERMPKEFSIVFAVSTVKRMPGLAITPAFMEWSKDNASIMAAIGRH